jgi:hypothetical protein
MTCHEIEALRLGLMNVLGTEGRSAREHARTELGDDLSGPIEALADADTVADLQRHLDAALVDLEERVAAAGEDDPDYDYLRGRLVAVRDAERAVGRLAAQGEDVLAGLGDAHDLLHETFPDDD